MIAIAATLIIANFIRVYFDPYWVRGFCDYHDHEKKKSAVGYALCAQLSIGDFRYNDILS